MAHGQQTMTDSHNSWKFLDRFLKLFLKEVRDREHFLTLKVCNFVYSTYFTWLVSYSRLSIL
jgi:hypothetical protein